MVVIEHCWWLTPHQAVGRSFAAGGRDVYRGPGELGPTCCLRYSTYVFVIPISRALDTSGGIFAVDVGCEFPPISLGWLLSHKCFLAPHVREALLGDVAEILCLRFLFLFLLAFPATRVRCWLGRPCAPCFGPCLLMYTLHKWKGLVFLTAGVSPVRSVIPGRCCGCPW